MTISNDTDSSINNNNEAVRDARPRTGRKKTNNKFNVMDISNHRDDVVPKNMELEEDEFHFEGADYLLKALSGGLEEMDSLASTEAFTRSPGGLRRLKKTISPRRPRTEAVKANSQFTYPMENLPL